MVVTARMRRSCGLLVLFVPAACALFFFAAFLMRGGHVGAGIVVGILGLVFALPALPFLAGARIDADDEGLRVAAGLSRRAIPWDEVKGLAIDELRIDPLKTFVWRYRVLVTAGAEVVFTSHWDGGEALAASVQRRKPAPEAEVDKSGATVVALDGRPLRRRPSPEEALRLDAAAVDRFVEVVRAELATRGETAPVDRDELAVATSDGTLELFGLGRLCARVPATEWPTVVRDHLDKIQRTRVEGHEIESEPFEAIAPRLRLEIFPAVDVGPEIVARSLAPGLAAVLVVEVTDGYVSATRATAAKWGRERRELLRLGQKNLRRAPRPTKEEKDGITMLSGDEITAAQLFRLHRHVEVDPDIGAIVALPSQRHLLAFPLFEPAALILLTDLRLVRLAASIHAGDHRALTPELFWWRRRRLTPVPVRPGADGGLVLVIPDELSGLLVGRIPR
jgi:hypothetical protein